MARDPRMPYKIIRNFEDFIDYHSDHSPIYYCRKRLAAGYNLTIDLKYRYRFETPEVLHPIEKAIAENPDMFIRYSTPYYYYPDSAMTREEKTKDLPGEILFVKKRSRRTTEEE